MCEHGDSFFFNLVFKLPCIIATQVLKTLFYRLPRLLIRLCATSK